MPVVKLPGNKTVRFPDTMSEDDINSALENIYSTEGNTGILESVKGDVVKPTNWGDIISKESARTGGGIVGGALAATLPEPAKFITIPAGVTLGAAAGEAMRQIGQHIFKDPERPQTSLEAAKKIGTTGLKEGAWELGGGLATKGIMRMLQPFSKKISVGALDSIELMKGRISPVLTPSEATQSRFLDIAENIADSSLIGGGAIETFKLKRQKAFDIFADELIDQFGMRVSPDDLGEMFIDTVSGKWDLHKKAANILYNKVEDLAKGVIVPIKKLKSFATPLSEVGKELGGIEAVNAGDDLMKAVIDLPDTLTFSAAKDLRSRLISRVDEFNILNKNAPAIGKAKKLISILDESIGKSLRSEGASVLDAWRVANNFYKTGSKQFNNTMIRRFIKMGEETGTGPENIGKAIFKPGAVTTVRRVKNALSPNEWKSMQSFYIQQLFTKSSNKEGVIQGERLLNNMIGKSGSMGESTLKEIFNPEQLNQIMKFSNALKMTQSKQSGGLGGMFIQLTQAGAVVGLALGKMPSEAGVILLGPAVISKLILNPKTARLLTEGIKLHASSPKVIGITTRLLAAAGRIKSELEESTPANKEQQ